VASDIRSILRAGAAHRFVEYIHDVHGLRTKLPFLSAQVCIQQSLSINII